MREKIDNIITFFIMILIIIILAATVYFCLDVFAIIEVPEKYSIAALLYSKIEVRAASVEGINENIIDEDFDTVVKKKKKQDIEEVISEPVETSSKTLEEVIDEVFSNTTSSDVIQNIDADNEDANRFYYSQLDVYGKLIYDKLYENKDKLKTGTYTADFGTAFDELLHEENGSETLNNSFQLAINALTFDNPDLFYIDVTKVYLLTEITTRAFSKTYKVSIGGNNGESYLSDNFYPSDNAKYSIGIVEQYKNSIVEECKNLSTVEKIRYVNNYLIDNTDYDILAGNNVYNIYGTLVEKKAVCEGYARACKYILDELEIPCIIACGIAKNSQNVTESHAWNYVKVDENWYALDITWNDPIINNGTGRITDEIRYAYFLKGSNKFFEDHFEDGNIVGNSNFKYPTLSVLNYE